MSLPCTSFLFLFYIQLFKAEQVDRSPLELDVDLMGCDIDLVNYCDAGLMSCDCELRHWLHALWCWPCVFWCWPGILWFWLHDFEPVRYDTCWPGAWWCWPCELWYMLTWYMVVLTLWVVIHVDLVHGSVDFVTLTLWVVVPVDLVHGGVDFVSGDTCWPVVVLTLWHWHCE